VTAESEILAFVIGLAFGWSLYQIYRAVDRVLDELDIRDN